MMRTATETELAQWDNLVAANPDGGQALQTLAWGNFKQRWGWEPRRYIYELADGRHIATQWLVRRVPLQGEIWYCPKGPGVVSAADFKAVVSQTAAANLPGIFMRFESEVLHDDIEPAQIATFGLVRANRDPGSKSTIVVDLSAGEDVVWQNLKQSARRSARKAAEAGVQVEAVTASAASLQTMYELMHATEARAKYGLRPERYFKDYWQAQSEAGQGQLFFASHEGEILAGAFISHLGHRAWYKDGGSFDIKRDLGPSYAVQWELIRWLVAHGVTSYDMVGVPNRDKVGTGDSRDGLYAFKSKFNPEITEFIGCWDLVLSAPKYKFWGRYGERIAGKLAQRSPEKFLY